MKLYHGTAESHLSSILGQGIKPRGKGKGNWRHSVESNPNFVYLTNAYALYFAGNAVEESGRLAVIEIDTDLLSTFLLAPDEDWLEQVTRKAVGEGFAPTNKSMKYRTRWYRRRLHNTLGTDYWKRSIDGLGTCTHFGTVPVGAITRVAVVEYDTYMRLLIEGGLDPSISIMNYRIVGDKYRGAIQWLFDGVEPYEDAMTSLCVRGLLPEQCREFDEARKRTWSRQGIEVRHVKRV